MEPVLGCRVGVKSRVKGSGLVYRFEGWSMHFVAFPVVSREWINGK